MTESPAPTTGCAGAEESGEDPMQAAASKIPAPPATTNRSPPPPIPTPPPAPPVNLIHPEIGVYLVPPKPPDPPGVPASYLRYREWLADGSHKRHCVLAAHWPEKSLGNPSYSEQRESWVLYARTCGQHQAWVVLLDGDTRPCVVVPEDSPCLDFLVRSSMVCRVPLFSPQQPTPEDRPPAADAKDTESSPRQGNVALSPPQATTATAEAVVDLSTDRWMRERMSHEILKPRRIGFTISAMVNHCDLRGWSLRGPFTDLDQEWEALLMAMGNQGDHQWLVPLLLEEQGDLLGHHPPAHLYQDLDEFELSSDPSDGSDPEQDLESAAVQSSQDLERYEEEMEFQQDQEEARRWAMAKAQQQQEDEEQAQLEWELEDIAASPYADLDALLVSPPPDLAPDEQVRVARRQLQQGIARKLRGFFSTLGIVDPPAPLGSTQVAEEQEQQEEGRVGGVSPTTGLDSAPVILADSPDVSPASITPPEPDPQIEASDPQGSQESQQQQQSPTFPPRPQPRDGPITGTENVLIHRKWYRMTVEEFNTWCWVAKEPAIEASMLQLFSSEPSTTASSPPTDAPPHWLTECLGTQARAQQLAVAMRSHRSSVSDLADAQHRLLTVVTELVQQRRVAGEGKKQVRFQTDPVGWAALETALAAVERARGQCMHDGSIQQH